MPASTQEQSSTMSTRFGRDGVGWIAAGFVIFWCTGYVVAKLSLPDAAPMSFLALRFGFACVAMAAIAALWRARWPLRWQDYLHAVVVGVLVHCLGLGGVWVALELGVEAGVAALIMGTQPLLTALIAVSLLDETVNARLIVGLLTGFGGIVLVIFDKLDAGVGSMLGLAATGVGVAAITVGTLYQTRLCAHLDLRSSNTIQLLSACVLASALALTFEDRGVDFTRAVVFSLVWSVFVLSIAATVLLYWLFRRGAAAQTASLFYLIPPLTALIAWADFHEAISVSTILGMALSCFGVGIVLRAR